MLQGQQTENTGHHFAAKKHYLDFLHEYGLFKFQVMLFFDEVMLFGQKHYFV